jgi:hypothetical protein
MTVFTVGKARIARIEETYGPTYRAGDIFSEFDGHILARHAAWLAPSHYDAASGFIKLSVHSWLLQIGGQNILIDGCCGNNKVKPARPFWNLLDTPYLDRLAAAGARPHEIDYVMCTHLHHDHVGWNTLERDGRWVPTFPNARYVFSKPDFDYYHRLDSDPNNEPAEFGTFRECVLPVVEAGRADLVTGPHRLNDFIEIMPAPAIPPAMWCSISKAAASAQSSWATCSTTCCKSITPIGISPRTRTPGRRGRAAAAFSSIARRPVRSPVPAMSAHLLPVASKRWARGSCRGLRKGICGVGRSVGHRSDRAAAHRPSSQRPSPGIINRSVRVISTTVIAKMDCTRFYAGAGKFAANPRKPR